MSLQTRSAHVDVRTSDKKVSQIATWPTSELHEEIIKIKGDLSLDYYQGFLQAWSVALQLCEMPCLESERIAIAKQACARTARHLQVRSTEMGPLQVPWDTLDIPAAAAPVLKNLWAEVLRCLAADCYTAAVGVCGKIVEETLLHVHSREFPSESARKLLERQGINALWTPLRNRGLLANVTWAVEVISEYRNVSVHAGRGFVASRENSTAVASLTKDLLLKVWVPGGQRRD